MYNHRQYHELRARRALMLSNTVQLATRRGLSLCVAYGDSTLLVLNSTLFTSIVTFWISANDVLKSLHNALEEYWSYTLHVTTRDHVVRCRGSQECGSRNVNFACKFHRRSHRVRITLKSTTLLFMRTRNV